MISILVCDNFDSVISYQKFKMKKLWFLLIVLIAISCEKSDDQSSAASVGWINLNSGTSESLYGIWGSGTNDIFAVGNNGTILHYNGTSWSSMNSGTTNPLYGAWGFASNDVYAVGEKLTILHYNGTSWTKMAASNPGFSPLFRAIWGASNSDLWAVGSGYLRMHYNGTAWSGSTNIITNNLYACWGSSSSYVLAVGDFGSVYRYNGTSWSGDLDVSNINDLWLCFEGIWGVNSSEVYLVGDYDPNGTGDGDNSGTVIKYTGSEWISLWKDSIPELRGIWGVSSTDFYVVGLKGSIAHYDGSAFKSMESKTTNNLLGIWGNEHVIIVVGANGTILSCTR